MAKPVVFICSTFNDLAEVRSFLDRALKTFGCEPVSAERGQVAYSPDKPLPENCYEEVARSNLLVSVIGARYGSRDIALDISISEAERQVAYEKGIHIITFIHRDASQMHKIFVRNDNREDIAYPGIESIDVLKFIDRVRNEYSGLPVFEFTDLNHVEELLQSQLASLLTKSLNTRRQELEVDLGRQMQRYIEEMRALLREHSGSLDSHSMDYRRLCSHPVVREVATVLNSSYRAVFRDLEEMVNLFFDLGYTNSLEPAAVVFMRRHPAAHAQHLIKNGASAAITNLKEFVATYGGSAIDQAELVHQVFVQRDAFVGDNELVPNAELRRTSGFVTERRYLQHRQLS
jgi:hypothetical protein